MGGGEGGGSVLKHLLIHIPLDEEYNPKPTSRGQGEGVLDDF